jgi:hypothetical protein
VGGERASGAGRPATWEDKRAAALEDERARNSFFFLNNSDSTWAKASRHDRVGRLLGLYEWAGQKKIENFIPLLLGIDFRSKTYLLTREKAGMLRTCFYTEAVFSIFQLSGTI